MDGRVEIAERNQDHKRTLHLKEKYLSQSVQILNVDPRQSVWILF